MGANEKRSLSVSAMSIFLAILLQLVFNTKHIVATTSLSAQFNFNNNNSSSTYRCNGSVHECLIMDGIDSELIFMDSVHTSRMLASTGFSVSRRALDAKKPPANCGREDKNGKPYTKDNDCIPYPNRPPPTDPCPKGSKYKRGCSRP